MEEPYITDVAVAVAGNVDSGKSTFIGVAISGILDNGNGSARSCVAVHPHEIKTGKTSSISTRVYYTGEKRAITFIDLCGHERYFGTTSFGISGHFPDYAFVLISANRGVLTMTRQHIRILMSFSIPIIFIITHIDLIPENNVKLYECTKHSIGNICCTYTGKTSESSVVSYVNNFDDQKITDHDIMEQKENLAVNEILSCIGTNSNGKQMLFPVITISNKTGFFFGAIRKLLRLMTPRPFWTDDNKIIKMFQTRISPTLLPRREPFVNSIFYIDTVYNPVGVGIVVCGILRGFPITKNSSLFIGPFGRDFVEIKVRSMHNNARQSITQMDDHHRGCIAIASKKTEITRKQIKMGVVIINSLDLVRNVCFNFKAVIIIFTGKTTIKSGYIPVLHTATIRQPARLNINASENEGRETIDTNTVSIVRFKFLFRAEYMEPYTIFVFRNGSIEGIGMVLETISILTDTETKPEIVKRHKQR